VQTAHTFTQVTDPTSKDVVKPSNRLLILQLWFELGDDSIILVCTIVNSIPYSDRAGIHGIY
jgi:hypothetical protein